MASLVVDSGNTRVKLGVFVEGQLQHTASCEIDSARNRMAQMIEDYRVEQVMVSDVSGQLKLTKIEFGAKVKLYYLEGETHLPFINLYESKATLGADRKALVAGALHFFEKQACLIIDAGTCVTYDIINASHEYLGGNISPGLQMRLRAMHEFTGKLPMPVFQLPAQVLGKNTQECLTSGAYFGLIGEINFLIDHYEQNWPQLKVLLTGGDAELLAKSLKTSIFVNEHLLLYGLNKILTHYAE